MENTVIDIKDIKSSLYHVNSEAYSGPIRRSKMEPFAKIVNYLQPLASFAKVPS